MSADESGDPISFKSDQTVPTNRYDEFENDDLREVEGYGPSDCYWCGAVLRVIRGYCRACGKPA